MPPDTTYAGQLVGAGDIESHNALLLFSLLVNRQALCRAARAGIYVFWRMLTCADVC